MLLPLNTRKQIQLHSSTSCNHNNENLCFRMLHQRRRDQWCSQKMSPYGAYDWLKKIRYSSILFFILGHVMLQIDIAKPSGWTTNCSNFSRRKLLFKVSWAESAIVASGICFPREIEIYLLDAKSKVIGEHLYFMQLHKNSMRSFYNWQHLYKLHGKIELCWKSLNMCHNEITSSWWLAILYRPLY